MMSDQQFGIVVVAWMAIMILQYFVHYSRGFSMKLSFGVVTLILIIGFIIPTEESVIYSIFSLVLFVWMAMWILGFWKVLTYRGAVRNKVRLTVKAPTNVNVSKLSKMIGNRRIKFEWLMAKDERTVDAVAKLYQHVQTSHHIDPEVKDNFEAVLLANGFRYVMEEKSIVE